MGALDRVAGEANTSLLAKLLQFFVIRRNVSATIAMTLSRDELTHCESATNFNAIRLRMYR
jgi:hypothetical protein